MGNHREAQILDAAYACFTRHGLRRTTIDDIAREAGVSRPTVYQHVANKTDAFARVTTRMLETSLAHARAAASSAAPLQERVTAVLEAKLALTLQVWRDSPNHAAEILGLDVHAVGASLDAYTEAVTAILTGALADRLPADDARAVAEILLALTRGLEADPAGPDPTALLHRGVRLVLATLPDPTETS